MPEQVVPYTHKEDKRSKGFSEQGIPAKDAPKFFEDTKAQDTLSKGSGKTGPVELRE